jgi:hypothetical protein
MLANKHSYPCGPTSRGSGLPLAALRPLAPAAALQRWQALWVTEQKRRIRNETPARQITAFRFVIVDCRQSEPADVANSRWSRAHLNFCANLPVALSLTAPANYAPQRTALPGRRWALRSAAKQQ